MASLQQLLAQHGTALVLDAASSRIQTGWLDQQGAARWITEHDEAGVALFRGIQQLGHNPTDAGVFIFCEGPGSILGIRTAAAAIRAWHTLKPRAVYAYQSLDLVARALNQPAITVIADARRQLWHAQTLGHALQRVSVPELSGRLVMPEGFRFWSTAPADYDLTPYDLSQLFPATAEQYLFRACTDPDAFMHSEPDYKTWAPQIHRAP